MIRPRRHAWRACRSRESGEPCIAGSWPEGGCWRGPGSTTSSASGCRSGASRSVPAPVAAAVRAHLCRRVVPGRVRVRPGRRGRPCNGARPPHRRSARRPADRGTRATGGRLLVGLGLGGQGVPARATLELAHRDARGDADVARFDPAPHSQPRRRRAGGGRLPRSGSPPPRLRWRGPHHPAGGPRPAAVRLGRFLSGREPAGDVGLQRWPLGSGRPRTGRGVGCVEWEEGRHVSRPARAGV